MPSLLNWNYLPGIADDEQPVEQRVYAGDMVIFRGDLSHAGAAFYGDNLRLHVYIDSPVYPREAGATFPEA